MAQETAPRHLNPQIGITFLDLPSERESETFGPYEYVQGTYDLLRAGTLAGDDLFLATRYADEKGHSLGWKVMAPPHETDPVRYSDFVVAPWEPGDER